MAASAVLPSPSGQYPVGCAHLMHKFEDDADTLLVRLFYPCQEGGGGRPYTQWVPHERYVKGYNEYWKFMLPESGISTEPQIPALYGAPLQAEASTATSQSAVLVYSHGLGAMSMTYSAICCDLASHGYVVASVEHRDCSACVSHLRVPASGGGGLTDEWLEHHTLKEGEEQYPFRNKQVKKRSSDARRALDLLRLLNEGAPVGNLLEVDLDFGQFKGRLDLNMAGMMGHSFGGATVIQTLSEDQRFKCGVCLDVWMLSVHKNHENGFTIQQPLIFINSSDFHWKENIEQMTKMTKPSNEQGLSVARMITLMGTNHYYQSDVLFTFPSRADKSFTSTLDVVTAHRVNMDVSHAFLKRHLLMDSSYQGPIPNLDGCEGHSEHVMFGSNVAITPSEQSTCD
ncbi:platelet-activating factor acetylhydrolase-like [Halichondria panicea]|uniref:platelet-activating factor acetylhydrolase-like n=1 Tax=Halichondria panicea TaxID=6063 RepID=UPI00312B5E84